MKSAKRILYIQYTNPGGYPPLAHSSHMLAEAGWEVLFLGTGALGADALRMTERSGILVRQIPFHGSGFGQKLHYVRFCLWCLSGAVRFKADWIYASDMLSCPAALLIRLLCGTPVIYHEHDEPAGARSQASVFSRLQFTARRACARLARLCVIPNAARARRFAAETGVKEPAVVWNCPGRAEVVPGRPPADGRIRLLYHGTIVPERVPSGLVDALAELPENFSLTLVGYETIGAPGYIDRLCRRAEEQGVRHRLECLGPLSRKELMLFCQTCDVGIALVGGADADPNLRSLAGASNKVFDYLACGLPVVVSALPDWKELFVQPGYGVSSRSMQESDLAAAIRGLCQDPARMRAMGEKGRIRIETEWNYERQFQPVWNLLHESARSAHSPLSGLRDEICSTLEN